MHRGSRHVYALVYSCKSSRKCGSPVGESGFSSCKDKFLFDCIGGHQLKFEADTWQYAGQVFERHSALNPKLETLNHQNLKPAGHASFPMLVISEPRSSAKRTPSQAQQLRTGNRGGLGDWIKVLGGFYRN